MILTLLAGLSAVLAGLLPLYIIRFPFFGIPTNAFEVMVWIYGAYTLCIPNARKQWLAVIYNIPRGHKIWIICFFLAAIISTIHSPILRSSLGILKGWILTPMLFASLVYAFGNRAQVIRSLALSGCVVALLGISQIEGLNRISAFYDVPNSLALFLVPVAVLALAVGFQTNNRLLQLFAAPMFVAIIGTQSFGAIIAFAGTAVIVVSLSPRGERVRVRAVRGAIFVTIVCIVLFTLSGRISYMLSPLTTPGTTNSATVRLQLWDIGIDLIKKNSILGIGLGQFEGAYQSELHRLFAEKANEANAAKSYRLQPEFVFRDPHNWPISFWLNMGILGLISFVVLNYITIKSAPSPIALALISILILGLVDTIYWKNDLSALWWLLWCVHQNRIIINSKVI